MVVIVTHPILVAGRRPRRLDPPDKALVGQQAEGIVYGLSGDGADLGPHRLGDVVRGAVRSTGHGAQDGQTLRRDLDTVLSKKVGSIT